MKTSLQSLITFLDDKIKSFEFDPKVKGAFVGAKQEAERLLEKEKAQIIEAYTSAQITLIKTVAEHIPIPRVTKEVQAILNGEDNEDAIDYFAQTFNN